ncbi:TPA: gamma-aminobutyrate permease, partial [Staphylococcus aureus]|nr:gamma-aminobutyrate permease [Staphylococcus aureus]
PEELEGHPFKMPGGAVTNYLTILFLILVLVGMVFNVETRISVLIGVIFLTIVTIYYFIRYNKNNVKAK